MIYFTSTLLNIIVYLITFSVMWRVFRKREEDLETEYRLNYARMCTTFIETMQTVSKALDTDEEPEQPTLGEWAETLCKATGCEFIADNGCKRTDEDYDGTCPCDIDGANK
jgi:hypothetical protein